ncbi:MAG: type II CAAX endopeptidase family protein, partial [Candidatus Promineifilaceae bacterium]
IHPIGLSKQKEKTKRIAIYISLFFAAWFVRVLIYLVFDRTLPTETLRSLSSFTFRILFWVVPVFLYLRYVDKTSSLQYLKLTTNLKTAVLASIGVILVGVVWQVVLLAVKADQFSGEITFWGLFNGVIVPPINEEILMRGFILTKLREVTTFWKANIITSLVFVAIHWPGWNLLFDNKLDWMLKTSVSIFILSLLLGYLVRKTDSLWPSIVLHAVNNLISSI